MTWVEVSDDDARVIDKPRYCFGTESLTIHAGVLIQDGTQTELSQ